MRSRREKVVEGFPTRLGKRSFYSSNVNFKSGHLVGWIGEGSLPMARRACCGRRRYAPRAPCGTRDKVPFGRWVGYTPDGERDREG